MDESTQILLGEYAQVRDSERASRSLLLQINTLAIAVVSGLLLAITQYKVDVLVLFGPLVFYFVGFFYSAEALRLLSLVEYARRIERELRVRRPELPAGFEDTVHRATGFAFLLRYNSGVAVAPACFYGIFYLLFFYLLAVSAYPLWLKLVIILLYTAFGAAFWSYNLWTGWQYLFRREPPDAP